MKKALVFLVLVVLVLLAAFSWQGAMLLTAAACFCGAIAILFSTIVPNKRLMTLGVVAMALPLFFAAVTQIDLTQQVKGTLPHGNGGTDSSFFSVAGPTATRVYTFPDTAATIEWQANKNAASGYAGLDAGSKLSASQLPNPSATTLGGVESKDCTGSGHIVAISIAGVPSCAADASGPTFADNETPTGTIDGSNAVFTTAVACTGLHLFKNGQRMTPGAGADYTYSASTITFAVGAKPKTGDVLLDDCRS